MTRANRSCVEPACPSIAPQALLLCPRGSSPEMKIYKLMLYIHHLILNPPLPLCHTATHVFVNSNQMSNEVYFLRICKMYFLLDIVRIFSLQGPSLTTAPIDASYNFTLYSDDWVFEKAADRHEVVKDEAKKAI